MRCLLGPDNVAGPTLASLTTNFGLQSLIGKSCAIVSDARFAVNAEFTPRDLVDARDLSDDAE